MKKRVSLSSVVLYGGLIASAMAQDYDLVINNSRIMDPETMYDAVRNVGIKDGRIAVITEDEITGAETIDATGHLVAPGFIDTHYHSLDGLSMKMAGGTWEPAQSCMAPPTTATQ